MPSAAQHQAKADRNRVYLDSGLAAIHPDWAAVVAFYAAVHLVEKLAALERSGPIHNASHSGRQRWLTAHRQHRRIFREYEELKRASELSRYGTINQFEQAYDSASVQSQLIDVHLAAIEAYVHLLTSPPSLPAKES